MQINIKKLLKNTGNLLLLILGGLLLAVVLRVFLFASYKIPSPSMEPAILAGDFIIVNKLIPGPRIMTNFFSLRKGEKPVFKRLTGYRSVRRNDVLVFNFPYSDWNKLGFDLNVYYAKRCVGIPGDTFYIENGIYKVNGVADTLGNYQHQQFFAETNAETIDPNIYHCFPFDSAHNWNTKQFGPLYIPKSGDNLPLDTFNIMLYKNLIRHETDKPVAVENGHVLLGDSIINAYTFAQNYYFTAGDFVADSKDSRYWGLLPEEHIVGKVAFVWKSEDMHSGKIRWERIFKTIK